LNKHKKYLAAVLITICLLAGCTGQENKNENAQVSSSQETTEKQEQSAQEYLFKAKDMDSIQLTGQEILDGKEADMSVKISDDISMDFHLSRDNPNGTKMYAIYNSEATNLAVNYISPDVFDNDEAIASDYYQMACYDFNMDGIKEVIIACGNRNDKLSLFIFKVVTDSEFIFYPTNYILGYKDAYVNDGNEICVPSPNGEKLYKYNIKAQDAEYAKQSGPIKISVSYAEQEQLEKYINAVKYVVNEDGPSILIIPTETLNNVTIHSIEYNAETDMHYATKDLYNITTITPDKPLILQFFMPDFPAIGVSYTDAAGKEQFCGIGESLEDGSIFLFEIGAVKGSK
jgi:outer membrane murein-binding lipoprotein Lpp